MKKRSFAIILLLMVLLMTGCAGENNNVVESVEGQESYYTIKEVALPSPEQSVILPVGGSISSVASPIMFGNRVLCTSSVYDVEYNNQNFFLQVLDPGA